MLPTIEIIPSYHKRFLSGYPWLYANEIVQSQLTKALEPGELVAVAHQGKRIATGYFNRHSLIAFRALSTWDTDIHVAFFKHRLQHSLALRERFYHTPYYRLVHAEADGLPGLIIDRFDSVFVIQINTQGMEKLKSLLIEALQVLFSPTTLYFKNDSTVRALEGLAITEPEVIGEPLSTLTVIENNMPFEIDMTSSQKTGWFFDHRENRALIAKLAGNKTVIDYFCYSGGFSLQAAKQQAKRVIGIDRSEGALKNAKRSASFNHLSDICEFHCRDTFKDMDDRLQKGENFDIVVLDPPAFVKNKKDLIPGLKGYEKLLAKALPLVAPGGFLLIASCSYHVKEADLKICLIRALQKTKREGRIVQTLSAGFDHPIHPMLEESSYLKGFLVAM
ncbi:MAG TPA: class I SAM-dependent rRNA methyltransferase [Gammaproteobacteria bacterium]|nr:class I SAM-dependent rRNA methyltransferase [Gammaproteobacteria bacterium]